MVYGSAQTTNTVLRQGTGGRIKMTAAGLPTQHEVGVNVANPTGQPEEKLMRAGTVRVFGQNFALEDAIGSHACSLEANMRVTNGIPLGSPLLLSLPS
jgi:hypothetical protein